MYYYKLGNIWGTNLPLQVYILPTRLQTSKHSYLSCHTGILFPEFEQTINTLVEKNMEMKNGNYLNSKTGKQADSLGPHTIQIWSHMSNMRRSICILTSLLNRVMIRAEQTNCLPSRRQRNTPFLVRLEQNLNLGGQQVKTSEKQHLYYLYAVLGNASSLSLLKRTFLPFCKCKCQYQAGAGT